MLRVEGDSGPGRCGCEHVRVAPRTHGGIGHGVPEARRRDKVGRLRARRAAPAFAHRRMPARSSSDDRHEEARGGLVRFTVETMVTLLAAAGQRPHRR